MEQIFIEYGYKYLERLFKVDRSKIFFQPVKISAENEVKKIGSHNEHYLIFDVDNTEAFTITSDTDIVSAADFFTDDIPYLFYMLNGNLTIDTTGGSTAHTFLLMKFTIDNN